MQMFRMVETHLKKYFEFLVKDKLVILEKEVTHHLNEQHKMRLKESIKFEK